MGKYGPTAPIFGYEFWAQVSAPVGTIFSPKIIIKVGQKNNFREMLPIKGGKSNLGMLNMAKLTFF